jgi:hypothetical protein
VNGVKDVALLDRAADEPKALATQPPSTDLVLMFERLAKDPAVDVDKLERLIAMQERIMRHNAKAAFDAAFSQMQADMPEISERGQILVKGQLRSTYARLEDIHEAIKPVLKKHGFAVRHRTEWPEDRKGIIRIVGILSHEQGHSEESVFEAPMDRSDFRTDIQSMGSTVSYGRRYTTLDLLNIATRNDDNDGQRRKTAAEVPTPDGFDDWLADLESTAVEGKDALEKAWKASAANLKAHLVKHDPAKWEAIKKVSVMRGVK